PINLFIYILTFSSMKKLFIIAAIAVVSVTAMAESWYNFCGNLLYAPSSKALEDAGVDIEVWYREMNVHYGCDPNTPVEEEVVDQPENPGGDK
ncbi:MAG: hypothetical protein K2J42_10585, partial [Muribaculaceae bacterium]|nr:hypothetical protein [Muribaculaceae bacterium]